MDKLMEAVPIEKMDVSVLCFKTGNNYIFRNLPKNAVDDDEILEYINTNFGYDFSDSNTLIMISDDTSIIEVDFNKQLDYQHQLQKLGFNIVICCRCGSILIHKESDEKVQCNGCWNIVETQDCTDLNY